ncbi:S9 family peptidase [Hyphomonadaceae bacterium ML37]|nr:S9 family peptidase [Hyphomonadaceae bacterium ML37]
MKMLAFTAGAVLAVSSAASAHAEAGPLQFADVFSLEMAADVQISPDGRTIAYQRRSADIMSDRMRGSIWLVNFDGSGHRPLITGAGDYASPVWTPDSGRLVYLSSEDGQTELRMAWTEDARSARLARLPRGASQISISPDGAQIAFTMFVPGQGVQVDIGLPERPQGAEWAAAPRVDETIGYQADGIGDLPPGAAQIHVMASDGGAPRQVTRIENGSISGLTWTADSAEILFSHGGRAQDGFDFRESDIWAVRAADGETRQITDLPGAERSPRLSPDGRRLAFLRTDRETYSHQDNRLYTMPLSGGEPSRLLSDLDRGIAQAEWDGNGRGLWVRFDDRGHTVLGYAGLNGGLDRVTDRIGGLTIGRPYTSGMFSVSTNGRWAAPVASAQDLANVGAGARRGEARTLTDLNAGVLGARDLARVERFTWESSADGREIEGWIAYPPGFDPERQWPMILEIHGGPHTAYGPQFSGQVQLMAAAGYVVFYTNPRGSTSYGQDFANLIDKDYPGSDVDDLNSGVDALLARGFIDEDRLYVTGGSGGGVLTAWLIGTDERWRAAAVGKPVINWTSFALASDIGPVIHRYWFGVTPWDEPEEYWRRSPLSLVGNVSAPTMVFVGAEDRRTPVAEAEQYYNALQIRGIESRLVRIPDTFHGIADSRPSRLLYKTGHIIAWFNQHGGQGDED